MGRDLALLEQGHILDEARQHPLAFTLGGVRIAADGGEVDGEREDTRAVLQVDADGISGALARGRLKRRPPMDFRGTPQEATFRAGCRRFLDASAERKAGSFATWPARWGEAEGCAAPRSSSARKLRPGWPPSPGRRSTAGGASRPSCRSSATQEEAGFFVPRGYFEIGLGMCIPTMMAYATEAQKQRYVARAIAGEEIWCQLFSKPAAGSEKAGLRTRSVRDGDGWIINGQKIWTSGAPFADYGIIVTRSEPKTPKPKTPKHKGLTFFFLDMKPPGIEVRRIKQISGTSNFNEVYFTDVRVPDGQRLGAVGQGWGVAITTLMNERLAVGDVRGPGFDEIFHVARTIKLEDGRPSRTPRCASGWPTGTSVDTSASRAWAGRSFAP